jgi:hypothetical protein
MRFFQIAELIAWPEGQEPRQKFWILETNITIDGPRTRVTDKKFYKKSAAEKFLETVDATS